MTAQWLDYFAGSAPGSGLFRRSLFVSFRDVNSLPQMSGATAASAVPPDVRRWLRPAVSGQIISRALPLVRALPLLMLIGPKAAPGA